MLTRLVKSLKTRHAANRQRRAARSIISESGLFDAAWYLDRYPDVGAAGKDPLDHFIEHGSKEGRNPSERFDLRWYLRRNPDVANSDVNPLAHYLEHGRHEGRSISPVRGGADSEADTASAIGQKKKKKKGKDSPRVEPYPSDFIPVWNARPIDLRMLSGQNGEGEHQDPERSIARLRDHLSRLPKGMVGTRLQLFSLLPGAVSDAQEDGHARLSVELGLEFIQDAWFVTDRDLSLRLCSSEGDARQVRAFQQTPSGELICCGQAALVEPGQPNLLSIALAHQLYPLLVTFTTGQGELADAVFIPFPSLFRGGLHHPEWEAHATTDDAATFNQYMTLLAGRRYFPAKDVPGPALSRLLVDLRGANGTELLLSPRNLKALAMQFGLLIDFSAPKDDQALEQLASKLSSDGLNSRASSDASTKPTLCLPADSFPTLQGLLAREEDLADSTCYFCLADQVTGGARMLVRIPSGTARMDAFEHPGMPATFPSILYGRTERPSATGSDAALPLVIRFREEKLWRVDELMPLSPDLESAPGLASRMEALAAETRLTVLIDLPSDPAALALCLASLKRQSITSQLDILLLSSATCSPDQDVVIQHPRAAIQLASGDCRDERLNAAAAGIASEYLLFLDSSLCLPDPRALEIMLAISAEPSTGSVSCAIMREPGDAPPQLASAGYQQCWSSTQPHSTLVNRSRSLANLFPASTLPVAANDLRLLLIRTSVWREVGGLKSGSFSRQEAEVDLGLRLLAIERNNYCTTLVRAAVADTSKGEEQFSDISCAEIPEPLRQRIARDTLSVKKIRR